jgi:hypothetical protein
VFSIGVYSLAVLQLALVFCEARSEVIMERGSEIKTVFLGTKLNSTMELEATQPAWDTLFF